MSGKYKKPPQTDGGFQCNRCATALKIVKVYDNLIYCGPCREIEVRAALLAKMIEEFDSEPDETIE